MVFHVELALNSKTPRSRSPKRSVAGDDQTGEPPIDLLPNAKSRKETVQDVFVRDRSRKSREWRKEGTELV